MAGIYIHIPFCHQACIYCDFHFSTSLKVKTEMVEAICTELALRKEYLGNQRIDTIYFGGGTPSVLNSRELTQIFEQLHQNFTISPSAEITLEANPEDLMPSFLEAIKQIGVNRLSIGIQSFQPEILQWMNRNHSSEQAVNCVREAKKAGITNISIDLIFGNPQLTQKLWEEDLTRAIQLEVPHLSVYALTVENKTVLAHQVRKGLTAIPEDTSYAQQFMLAHNLLERQGYVHYELSNYALEEFASKHNSSYWNRVPYLGIGPSAHSFNGENRSWNINNNAKYMRAIFAGSLPLEEELLTKRDHYHEYIMTGLRQKKGIDVQYIKQKFGIDILDIYSYLLREWQKGGFIEKNEFHWRLTPKGWLISDQLISELFLD